MLRTVVKKYPFIRWCLAGRTPEKVHKVIDKVLAMPECAHVKYRPGGMQCSLGDATKLRRMVLSTDVVINIAGPYMKTGGEMLVEACLAYDTDYVDVNGEIPYTHKILDYHRYARQKGVFIVPYSAMVRRVTVAGMLLRVWFVAGVVTPGEGVEAERWLPCCVVLCNPHQAGGAPDTFVFYLVKLLKEKYHEKVRQIRCFVAASQGLAPSGGTLATRAAMAEALGLGDPGRSWHTDRGPILRIAGWMAQVVAALAAMGASLVALAASEVGEVRLTGAGASSTMPQKANPVGPSVLVALGHQMGGLMASLQAAAPHQHQRDGAAWFAEWMVLPQIALGVAAALETAGAVLEGLEPVPARMLDNLGRAGLIHAEALSFALAAHMPRAEAQAATKALVAEAVQTGAALEAVARAAHPDLPPTLFDPAAQMGDAPQAARAFAARAARGAQA